MEKVTIEIALYLEEHNIGIVCEDGKVTDLVLEVQ